MIYLGKLKIKQNTETLEAISVTKAISFYKYNTNKLNNHNR